jgi:hypothetical protein
MTAPLTRETNRDVYISKDQTLLLMRHTILLVFLALTVKIHSSLPLSEPKPIPQNVHQG